MPPNGDLMSRLQAFLPAMKSANAELQSRVETEGPAAVDIEHVEEDAPHIAMDVAIAEVASSDSDADSDAAGWCVRVLQGLFSPFPRAVLRGRRRGGRGRVCASACAKVRDGFPRLIR